MGAQAKIINMLLYDGTLSGVIRVEDSKWNAGELFSAPRESVSDLLKTGACSKYGVYLLLSADMVYVGQSSDLSKRLSQHIVGKDWWKRAVIITTKDDSLTHSDIDYLENILIEKAFSIKKLDCDNKKTGNPPKVDVFRKVFLSQYLDEALFLMQLIGITAFLDQKSKRKGRTRKSDSMEVKAEGLNLETPVSPVTATEERDVQKALVPQIADSTSKIGALVFSTMTNLANSGFVFSETDINEMCTSEWSSKTFHTKTPFMKRYTAGTTDTKASDGNVRYRATPLSFGDQQVLITKEWHERQRQDFMMWYASLCV